MVCLLNVYQKSYQPFPWFGVSPSQTAQCFLRCYHWKFSLLCKLLILQGRESCSFGAGEFWADMWSVDGGAMRNNPWFSAVHCVPVMTRINWTIKIVLFPQAGGFFCNLIFLSSLDCVCAFCLNILFFLSLCFFFFFIAIKVLRDGYDGDW